MIRFRTEECGKNIYMYKWNMQRKRRWKINMMCGLVVSVLLAGGIIAILASDYYHMVNTDEPCKVEAGHKAPGGMITSPLTQQQLDAVFGYSCTQLSEDGTILLKKSIVLEAPLQVAAPSLHIILKECSIAGLNNVSPIQAAANGVQLILDGRGIIAGGRGCDGAGVSAVNGGGYDALNITIGEGILVAGGSCVSGSGGSGINGLGKNAVLEVKGAVYGGGGDNGFTGGHGIEMNGGHIAISGSVYGGYGGNGISTTGGAGGAGIYNTQTYAWIEVRKSGSIFGGSGGSSMDDAGGTGGKGIDEDGNSSLTVAAGGRVIAGTDGTCNSSKTSEELSLEKVETDEKWQQMQTSIFLVAVTVFAILAGGIAWYWERRIYVYD